MFDKLTSTLNQISPHLRKIIGNTAWLFADRIMRLIFGLLIGVWVARYLGPDRYGIFNYAIAFVALFGWLTQLGLNRIVVRDIVRYPDRKNEILGTALVLKLLGGLAALAISIGLILFLRPDDRLTQSIVAIIAVSGIFKSFETIDFWFQSQVQSKYTVTARSTAYIITNLLKLLLIQIRAPLIAFAWVWSGEWALSALGLAIVYRIYGHWIRAWRFSWQQARRMLAESWPLMISGIVIVIYMKIDIIMIGQMLDDRAVGVYSAAVKISELWYFVPTSIVQSVFPSIVKAKEVNESLYYDRLQKLFNLMAVIGYVVAIPMTLLATPIIVLLFGQDYSTAGSILSVHIWAGLFVSLGVASSPWLITEGLTKFSAATTGCGAVVNMILNVLLIPRYGIMGAAIATVIAQLVASYLANLFYRRTRIAFVSQTRALTLIDLAKRFSRST